MADKIQYGKRRGLGQSRKTDEQRQRESLLIDRLRAILKQWGAPRAWLARELNVSEQNIGNWFSGRSGLSADAVQKINEVLHELEAQGGPPDAPTA